MPVSVISVLGFATMESHKAIPGTKVSEVKDLFDFCWLFVN